jgi:RHS repeat-associated protein
LRSVVKERTIRSLKEVLGLFVAAAHLHQELMPAYRSPSQRKELKMNPRRLIVSLIFLSLSMLQLPRPLLAQNDTDLQQGLMLFGTYEGGDIDSIDVGSARLIGHIPLWSYSQLGGRLHLNYFIRFGSPTFTQSCPPLGGCLWIFAGTGLPGVGSDLLSVVGGTDIYDPNHNYEGTSWSVTEPGGTSHQMGAIPSSGKTTKIRALDASGYYADLTNWSAPILYDASGLTYTSNAQGTTVQDSYGNAISSGASITDSIGRIIPQVPAGPLSGVGDGNFAGCGSTATTEKDWKIPAQQAGTVTLKLCFSQTILSGSVLLTDVVLPNGTAWSFAYELFQLDDGSTHAEVTQVTLPTGGVINYTWTTTRGNCHVVCEYRAITSRAANANDGQGPHTWTYQWQFGYPTRVLTITDPMGNIATHTSSILGYTWRETQYQQQDSHANVLKTVSTVYSSVGDSKYGALSVVPTSVTTQWPSSTQFPSGAESQQSFTYGASFSFADYANKNTGTTGLPNPVLFTANRYTVTDSDYGNGTPGVTLRTTTTFYQAFPNNSNACTVSYCTKNLLNLMQSVGVSGPGNSASTNYYYDAGGGSAGNLTSVQRLLAGSYITTDTMTYYSTGMLHTKADALSNQTTYVYDATNLFLQSAADALSHTTQYSYDAGTGVLNHIIDANLKQTSYTYDSMNRILSASYPDGGSTTYSYDDSPSSPGVTVSEAITSSLEKIQTVIVDGLGRVLHTQLNSDPEGVDYVDTTYDGDGRKASVSNPYRTTSEPTYGVTQYQYDALGRLLKQTQPDQSIIQSSYSGTTATVTDEAGKARKTQADGLGRLMKVWEDPNSLDYETDYGYDCLGNLTSVAQQGTNRSFVYDSLSRLTSATNPESGTTSYTYDNNGMLITKKDGRNITITYHPDALHRVASKSYSDSEPTIYYCYDNQQTACGTSSVSNGIGRRTGMLDASGSTTWSYDAMGRPLTINKTVAGVSVPTDYIYNLDGSLWELVYPGYSVDSITYQYSAAGRPLTATYDDSYLFYTFNYVETAKYTAAGELASYQSDAASPVKSTVTNSYNSRLQPTSLSVTTAQGNIFNLTYSFNAGSGDNGNIAGITNNLASSRSQTFTYDSLNRLYTAGTSGTWGDTYGYDSRGNLLSKTVTRGSGESWSNAVDANNHMTGWGYDGAGNLTSVDGIVYNTFNAENQWTQQSTLNVSYLYDGDGLRVKSSGGASGTRIYAYDAAGRMIEEFDQNGNVLNEYLYLGGRRIARVYDEGPTYYYYGDHLGTARVITDFDGNKCYDADYFPWGGEQQVYVNTCAQNYKFTGKERDPDMSVDYFGARFYKYSMARLYSPDPGNIGVNRLNPQSWNAYSYALNNPLSLTDPTGLYVCEDSTNCSSVNDQAFAKSLADAQVAVNRLTGEDQAAAQRAIDAYGVQGVDNGVNVRFDANVTGGLTEVSGVANGTKSTDNPNGQNINVTFNPNAIGGDFSGSLVAHEGSHTADASAWVASGFSAKLDPTNFGTEFNAYHVQFNVGNALLDIVKPPPDATYTKGSISFPKAGQLLWNKGDTFKQITPDLQQKIRENYNNLNLPAFQKGAVLQP